jgi:hypothetical protein
MNCIWMEGLGGAVVPTAKSLPLLASTSCRTVQDGSFPTQPAGELPPPGTADRSRDFMRKHVAQAQPKSRAVPRQRLRPEFALVSRILRSNKCRATLTVTNPLPNWRGTRTHCDKPVDRHHHSQLAPEIEPAVA